MPGDPMVCGPLQMQLASATASRDSYQSTLNSFNATLALNSASLQLADPGAPIPITGPNATARAAQLLMATPPNPALAAQYTAFALLAAAAAVTAAQVLYFQTLVDSITAQMVAAGC